MDISVLGRDILNIFAAIVDRTANRVVLLHGSDSYSRARASYWRLQRLAALQEYDFVCDLLG
jgi:hypothetical protein